MAGSPPDVEIDACARLNARRAIIYAVIRNESAVRAPHSVDRDGNTVYTTRMGRKLVQAPGEPSQSQCESSGRRSRFNGHDWSVTVEARAAGESPDCPIGDRRPKALSQVTYE